MSEDRHDLTRELAELVRGLRATLEVARESGAEGVPRAVRESAPARVAAEQAPERVADAMRSAAPAPPRAEPAPTRLAEPEPAAQSPAAAARPAAPAARDETMLAPAPSGAVLPPLADAEREHRLAVLAAEVASCRKCPLAEARTQTVFARGQAATELAFVGEGPGADEDAQGLPFVGMAGQLLDRMILAMGYGRDEVYICNIVKCRPPNNRKPTPDEMAACLPYLKTQLELVAPRAIVALGATAVEGLLGATGGITRLRGSWKLYLGRVPVMPTFHPAYLLRSPDKKREVWSDLQQVMRRLGKEPRPAH